MKVYLGFLIILALLGTWLFRYDIQPRASGYYKYDRWTHKVYLCGGECLDLH
jgi:hypothetical protein